MSTMRLELPATIRMYEAGPDGLAPPVVLLRHFQEAAGLHAERLGWGYADLLARNLTWVLTRLFFTLVRRPRPSENLLVRTWPVSRDKYNAKRDFAWLAPDGEELGRGTSNWVMMDLEARRLAAIPEDFDKDFHGMFPGHLEFGGKRVPALKEPEHERPVLARLEDLDVNAHVNNTHFVSWVMEAVPDDLLVEQTLAELDIQLRAEVRRGQRVRSQCGPDGHGGLLHSLVRDEDGVEVARARTGWMPRSD